LDNQPRRFFGQFLLGGLGEISLQRLPDRYLSNYLKD
jgi:hypothetical protein